MFSNKRNTKPINYLTSNRLLIKKKKNYQQVGTFYSQNLKETCLFVSLGIVNQSEESVNCESTCTNLYIF